MSQSARNLAKINKMKTAYEAQISIHRAEQQHGADEKIDRLKMACRELENILDEYNAHYKKVKQGALEVSAGNFRGELRKTHEEEVKRLAKALDQERKDHQRNVELLNNKIRDLETEKSALGDLIANVKRLVGALAVGM